MAPRTSRPTTTTPSMPHATTRSSPQTPSSWSTARHDPELSTANGDRGHRHTGGRPGRGSRGPRAAAGSPDPTSGSGGSIVIPLGTGPNPSSAARAVAVQPDGKLVFVGYATDNSGSNSLLVGRMDPSGNFDPTFGHGGKIVVQIATGPHGFSGGWSVALQPDGKILVGGDAFSDTDNGGFVVARLTPEGTFDSSFGEDGRASLDLGD